MAPTGSARDLGPSPVGTPVPRYVGLLRAVNVGGSAPVVMTDLVDALHQQGYRTVRTLLQSGNVVFDANARSTAAIERDLEALLRDQFRRTTDVFVRDAREWDEVIAHNPFGPMARDQPALLHVTFLKTAPTTAAWAALRGVVPGPEQSRGMGRAAYTTYPNGSGRSKVTIGVIEKALGTRGTSRNWNTVLRIRAALSD
jgi:uncharacterized protein (DUF1697 family)